MMFKVGDEVVCMNDEGMCGHTIGQVVVVEKVRESPLGNGPQIQTSQTDGPSVFDLASRFKLKRSPDHAIKDCVATGSAYGIEMPGDCTIGKMEYKPKFSERTNAAMLHRDTQGIEDDVDKNIDTWLKPKRVESWVNKIAKLGG